MAPKVHILVKYYNIVYRLSQNSTNCNSTENKSAAEPEVITLESDDDDEEGDGPEEAEDVVVLDDDDEAVRNREATVRLAVRR